MILSIICDDISGFSNGSDKNVIVQCPNCNEHRLKKFRKVAVHGHTICRSCLYKASKEEMVGKIFGELTVLGVSNKTLVVQCSCGTIKNVMAENLRSGKTISCGHIAKKNASERMRCAVGSLNPNWKDEKTETSRRTRNYDSQHYQWQKAIKERDISCINCNSTDELVAHHLNSYKWFPEQRYNLNNGVTLCATCHNNYHVWMGGFWVKSTIENFEEWFNDN